MGVLDEIKGVVRARQGRLEVAQQGIDGLELRQLDALGAAASDCWLVLGTDEFDATKAPQPIRHHGGRRCQRLGRKGPHAFGGEGLLGKARKLRMPIGRGLHGGNERHLILGAAPCFTAREFSTEIGIVHLDTPVQDARFFPLAHDLHELVFDEPSGFVANTQMAHKLQCGDVVLGLRQQVHGQKPARQAQLAGLEDGAADDAETLHWWWQALH